MAKIDIFSVIVNKNLSIVELFKKLNKRFSSELLYWLYLHSRINIWEYLWIIKRPDKSTSPPTQPFSNLTTFRLYQLHSRSIKTHEKTLALWNITVYKHLWFWTDFDLGTISLKSFKINPLWVYPPIQICFERENGFELLGYHLNWARLFAIRVRGVRHNSFKFWLFYSLYMKGTLTQSYSNPRVVLIYPE